MFTAAKCKINGIELRELSLNFVDKVATEQGSSIIYAACQYNPKTGRLVATHGKCTAPLRVLSKRTLDIIRDLKDSMEQDLLSRHFEEDTNERTVTNDEARITTGEDEEGHQI